MTKLFLERCNARANPLDRQLATDSTNTTKVQPDEPMSFVGVPYRNVVDSYLKEQEGLRNSCIAKAPLQLTKLGTESTLHSLHIAQQVEGCLSQVPWLV